MIKSQLILKENKERLKLLLVMKLCIFIHQWSNMIRGKPNFGSGRFQFRAEIVGSTVQVDKNQI